MTRNILSFYLTIAVPCLYALVLVIIFLTQERFPIYLGPVMQILSHPVLRSLNLAMTIVGIGLWVVSYVYLGRSFGVLPRKNKKVRVGPYKFLRHPMYVGIFLTFTGLSLTGLSVPGFVVNLAVLTPINWYRARREEIALTT